MLTHRLRIYLRALFTLSSECQDVCLIRRDYEKVDGEFFQLALVSIFFLRDFSKMLSSRQARTRLPVIYSNWDSDGKVLPGYLRSLSSYLPATFRIIFKFHKCHPLSSVEPSRAESDALDCQLLHNPRKAHILIYVVLCTVLVFLIFQHQSFEYPKILPEITRQERRKSARQTKPQS